MGDLMSRYISFIRLLVIPVITLGAIQFFFGLLSMLLFHDSVGKDFFEPAIVFGMFSLVFLMSTSKFSEVSMSLRQALLFVSLTWIVCSVEASVPIRLIEHISLTDSVFESVSALTTTGATVLQGLDEQPKTFLMYRQFLQWFGGMGVVVFVVAILPKLNVGGMKIFLAETPGPAKGEKLAPRITHTARYLWFIYFGLTFLCIVGYLFTGMGLFDSVAHAFTTVSTGGFSTHDTSLGFFHSHWVELNSMIFMLLGATSFALHFYFTQTKDLSVYTKDEENKDFLWLVVILSILLCLILLGNHVFSDFDDSVFEAVFQLISFITSTGYATSDFVHWPAATALLLIFAGYIGGCAGSTAGGNKMIRNIISVKVIGRQLKQLSHPKGQFTVKYNGRPVKEDISAATMSYMGIAAILTMVLSFILQTTGLDFWSSFTAVAACLNVLGPAFGELGANFQPVNDFGTWVLTFTMLLGRLEFFTLLVLFSPNYWKF